MRITWLVIFAAVFIWSAIEPKDRITWLLEVSPALIALIILAVTYNKFRLTPLVYWLILFHCVILMIGGHYTYADVPWFEDIESITGSPRNDFDKLAHFFQGFVPAVIAREILIRFNVINGRWWRDFFIVCFCLAVSAFYEMIEWWVAVASGDSAVAFLGTQGYEWDTQSDMALAMVGAITGLLLLADYHDTQLKRLRTM